MNIFELIIGAIMLTSFCISGYSEDNNETAANETSPDIVPIIEDILFQIVVDPGAAFGGSR